MTDPDELLGRLDNGESVYMDIPGKHYYVKVWKDGEDYRGRYMTPTINETREGSRVTFTNVEGFLSDFPLHSRDRGADQ